MKKLPSVLVLLSPTNRKKELQGVVADFAVIDSAHGQFIVNRHCHFQAETLIKTGATHIESELSQIFVIVDRLAPGSIIIDGGANAGFFTVPVANRTRGRDIRILSFEPQRRIFSGLAGSLVINDLDHVMAFNAALGAETGWCYVTEVDYSQPQDFGLVQIDSEIRDQRNWLDPLQSEVTTIDSLSLPRLDFLKLDVEGFEIAALWGGRDTIQQHRPWIWIEYFITGADAIRAELSYLTDYKFHVVDSQNMLCVPNERIQASGITISS
jgi:FkbM family methyltransferase